MSKDDKEIKRLLRELQNDRDTRRNAFNRSRPRNTINYENFGFPGERSNEVEKSDEEEESFGKPTSRLKDED